MESRYNIHDFLIEGKKVEKRFAERLLKEDKSSVIKYASKKDDICKHVDLYWNDLGVDVKGLKRSSRSGEIDENIHWVELLNVNGKRGWLFGEATYIVFEILDYWLIVNREKLIEFIKSKLKNVKDITFDNKPFYKRYQRQNRLDIITKVKTIDLMFIADKILKK